MTQRAAWNLAFQGQFFKSGAFPRKIDELPIVATFQGKAAIGSILTPPRSALREVRILPMESILPTKGTGVVTSVPSDSPDDYAMVRELAKKPEFYGIEREWAKLDEIVEIIETPSYGKLSAKTLVEQMKINSPKDAKLLAEAKELSYKEAYYKGKMTIGPYAGESVEAAKPKVRDELIKAGEAIPYSEPASLVVSRDGEECVVAYTGDWAWNYGEKDPAWQRKVFDRLKTMELYNQETRNAFEAMIEWLGSWSVSRSFGLGTRLPWEPSLLVEGALFGYNVAQCLQ